MPIGSDGVDVGPLCGPLSSEVFCTSVLDESGTDVGAEDNGAAPIPCTGVCGND